VGVETQIGSVLLMRSRAPAADPWLTPRRAAPTLIAAVLAGAYLIIAPKGADLPAQLLRTKLFATAGFSLWNNWWYGGHSTLSYSVLFPPLAYLLTPQLVAALASVVTAAAWEALAHMRFGAGAWLGSCWLAVGTVSELMSGRLTFALGLAGAALTALALQRRRHRAAAGVAFLTALASPVAALFAALAGAATALGDPTRRNLLAGGAVVVAALLPVVALAVAFPEGGWQPFSFSDLWPLLLVVLLLPPLASRDISQTESVAVALYGLGCLLAFVLDTPVGGNAARLGELVAGPLVAMYLYPLGTRRALTWLALLALPLTYIQFKDGVTDIAHGDRAPYDSAAYYRPLERFLAAQPGAAQHAFRVEIPFTQGHWETDYVAPEFLLARGWERQLDIDYNGLFYAGHLTAAGYERWLRELAVHYVAVADAPADYSARAEIALIDHGLPYLRLVDRTAHWRIYSFTHVTPIAQGTGRVTGVGPDSVTLDIRRPGRTYVRVRYSPYWQLSGVPGCVEPAGNTHTFTVVRTTGSGHARLTQDFSLTRIRAESPRCN
jgi:hypothetical protein